MRPLEFLYKYDGVIKKSVQGTGLLPSVLMAQAILETGWGVTVKANNMFGIKATGPKTPFWDGRWMRCFTHEIVKGAIVPIYCNFRVYDTLEASISDHNLLVTSLARYKKVLTEKTAQGQCTALQVAGYSTSPKYAKTLMVIIRFYTLTDMDK